MRSSLREILPSLTNIFKPTEPGLVEKQFRSTKLVNPSREARERWNTDPWLDFQRRLSIYLSVALEYGLEGQHIIDSCADLASTLTSDPEIQDANKAKIMRWRRLNAAALAVDRPSRNIELGLDPIYFQSLKLSRPLRKDYEGRAFHPDSKKQYQDLRSGDQLTVVVSQDREGWEEDCRNLQIDPSEKIIKEVGGVFFTPWVHGMFNFSPGTERNFITDLIENGDHLRISQAGLYYAIPGYAAKIKEFGFVGIQMVDPQTE